MKKEYLIILSCLVFQFSIVFSQLSQKTISSLDESVKEYKKYSKTFFNYYNNLPLVSAPETQEVAEAQVLARWINDINVYNERMQNVLFLYRLMKCREDKTTLLNDAQFELESNLMYYEHALFSLQHIANSYSNPNVIYHLNGLRKILEDYLTEYEKYSKKK